MTPQYILKKSLCRPAFCADEGAVERRRALDQIEGLEWAEGYSEPGYENSKKGVLFANWNYFSNDVAHILERYGYAVE